MKRIFESKQEFSLGEAVGKLCAAWAGTRRASMLARRGGKMVVYANDYIGQAVDTSGFYEYSELVALFDFLAPLKDVFRESIALDIGANIGNHSVFFARYFSEVHAFEPHPLTSRILDINASLYPGIVVHPYGLSDTASTAWLRENPTNLGGSRIVAGVDEGTLKVELRTLDSVQLARSKIALIKMDVEGYEASVLKGGMQTLIEANPIVLFEANAVDFSAPLEKAELLQQHGYRFAWFEPVGTGRLERYIRLLTMVITGRRTRTISTGDVIPRADHSMVIAVPPRWLNILKMI